MTITPAAQYLITIVSVIMGITIFSLGFIVYLNDRKNLINKNFLALTSFTTIWIITVITEILFKDSFLKILSTRIGFAATIWVAFFIYRFFCYFPIKNDKFFKWKFYATFIISFALSVLAIFTAFMLKTIESMPSGTERDVFGPGYYVFVGYFVIYFVFAVYSFISKFSRMDALQITQSKFILTGIAISVSLSLTTNLFLPKILNDNIAVQFGPATLIFFAILTTYAILKHRIFNLKIITAEFSTAIMMTFFIVRLFISINTADFLANLLSVLVVGTAGILLTKSIFKEVRQKENFELISKSLETTNKKLEQIDTARREFLSFASHQLRAPMTVIKGYANLIVDKNYLDNPERAKPILYKIINSTDQLDRLIKNFLDARAIEEVKMNYSFEPIDFVSLTSSVVDEFKSLAADKNLSLSFNSVKPVITVNADQMKLRQVIQNLVENAIKYTDNGFVKITIEDKGSSVLFGIADSGRGVSPQIKDRLFEQYVREKEGDHEIQGTGLGLYIAKEIIHAHNGKIWVESEGENKGSKFYIELPIG